MISNLIPENILCIIFFLIYWDLSDSSEDGLCRWMFPYLLEKNVHSAVVRYDVLWMSIRLRYLMILVKSSLFLLNFCLLVLSTDETNRKQRANASLKSKLINNYIKYKWIKHFSKKEAISLNKKAKSNYMLSTRDIL